MQLCTPYGILKLDIFPFPYLTADLPKSSQLTGDRVTVGSFQDEGRRTLRCLTSRWLARTIPPLPLLFWRLYSGVSASSRLLRFSPACPSGSNQYLFNGSRTRIQAMCGQKLGPDMSSVMCKLSNATMCSVMAVQRHCGRAPAAPTLLIAPDASQRTICVAAGLLPNLSFDPFFSSTGLFLGTGRPSSIVPCDCTHVVTTYGEVHKHTVYLPPCATILPTISQPPLPS